PHPGTTIRDAGRKADTSTKPSLSHCPRNLVPCMHPLASSDIATAIEMLHADRKVAIEGREHYSSSGIEIEKDLYDGRIVLTERHRQQIGLQLILSTTEVDPTRYEKR